MLGSPRCGHGDPPIPGCGPEDPSWLGAWRPTPRCGPGDPPRPSPSTSPLVWAWRPLPGQIAQLPLWVWAWRPARHAGIPPHPLGDLQDMLGYHLQCMLGYHPPVIRMRDRCKNITLPQTSFAGGKKMKQTTNSTEPMRSHMKQSFFFRRHRILGKIWRKTTITKTMLWSYHVHVPPAVRLYPAALEN